MYVVYKLMKMLVSLLEHHKFLLHLAKTSEMFLLQKSNKMAE